MNIWINNPFDNLEEEGARPQRYAMLTKELVRRGHHVVWWTSDFSHVHKAKRVDKNGLTLEHVYTNAYGVEMRLLSTKPYKTNTSFQRILSHRAYAGEWLRVAKSVISHRELPPPDTIITSLPPLCTHKTALKLRDDFKCRLVVDIQDAWPEAIEELLPLPRSLRNLAKKIVFSDAHKCARTAFLTADCITAVGRSYLDIAKSYGATAPMKEFRLGITDVADNIVPITDGPVRLVYGGNMGKSYDLETLIRAVISIEAEAPGCVSLDLAGTGPDENRIRKLAAGCNAIKFHGFLQREEFEKLLRKCEIGIIPMFDRSFVAVPNKVADYTAAGLAVINSLSGETKDLLLSANAGLWYQAGNVDSLVNAIKSLTSDRGRLSDVRNNALSLAKREFLASAIYPVMCDFANFAV